ncbi:MAG: hypothetical protein IJV27_07545 [Prevotella sp.]|nr:hypothetical protein [Prevotella sp.]
MKRAETKYLVVQFSRGLEGLSITGRGDDFEVSHNMGDTEEIEFTLTPTPEDAVFDPNKITFEISDTYSGVGIENWSVAEIEEGDTEGTWVLVVKNPGNAHITISYDGEDVGNHNMDVTVPFDPADGWSWYSGPLVPDWEQVSSDFINSLVEVRSQESYLYNDPVYGFFGDIYSIEPFVCYKIKMDYGGTDIPNVPSYYNGEQVLPEWEVSLNKGWTWIPNTYLYNRLLNNVLTGSFEVGDMIKSKSGGYAKYDGSQWTGTLTTLNAGEGYLFYTAGEDKILGYVSEANFLPQHDAFVARSKASAPSWQYGKNNFHNSIWQYDASRFSDNMALTAIFEGIDFASDFTVGAFVGDECRGEGIAVNDRFFITAHADAGEPVSFRLFNSRTGELFNVEGTIPMQQRVGSINQPKILKKGELINVVDSIDSIQLNREDSNATTYRIDGVKVDDCNGHGLYIVKTRDGVKKIMKR